MDSTTIHRRSYWYGDHISHVAFQAGGGDGDAQDLAHRAEEGRIRKTYPKMCKENSPQQKHRGFLTSCDHFRRFSGVHGLNQVTDCDALGLDESNNSWAT